MSGNAEQRPLVDHICPQCGRQWTDTHPRHDPTFPDFCTPECADAWMDAHPDEKQRRRWITRQDLVDRMLVSRGLIPMPRATPRRGDN